MFSCYLPPALLAKWPGYFTCYCGNIHVHTHKYTYALKIIILKMRVHMCEDTDYFLTENKLTKTYLGDRKIKNITQRVSPTGESWKLHIHKCDKRVKKRTCNTLTHGSLSNLIFFVSEACASVTSELPSFPWFSSSGDGLFWPGLLSCDALLCVGCDETSQPLDCCKSGRCCWLFCQWSCRPNCPLLPRPRILLKQNIFCKMKVKAIGVRLKWLKSSGPSESH